MNRCEVCDKTDEDDPKAGIVLHEDGPICLDCITIINQNFEDLSINDELPIYSFVTEDFELLEGPEVVVEANGKQNTLPEVSE